MTREEANKILDQVREGYPYPETLILKCLNITGDYRTHEELRSERLDEEAEDKDWRARVRQRAIMVGRSKK